MPGPSDQEMRGFLDADDFGGLFRRLGWDNPVEGLAVSVEAAESAWVAEAVADKRGVTVWSVAGGEIPPRSVQHQIVKAAKRLSRDQLMVFTSPGEQLWLWPEQRPSGVGHRLVDHHYRSGHGNEGLLERLRDVCFTVSEEEELSAVKVLERVRRSFNVEKVTKSFFREFKDRHERLAEHIEGIPRPDDQRWYASVLMNRLMFVYFIQRKGFVAGDHHYLRNRLPIVRERLGADQFYAFFRRFLLPLFHQWRWHLDERTTGDAKEMNPDILGFIFEQYVNKKQQGGVRLT